MGIFEEKSLETTLPKMVRVRQIFNKDHIPSADLPAYLLEKLSAPDLQNTIRPGMRVCITAGSRGIANYALVIRTVADFIRDRGALPFIVPSMGSHGGATAEGQREILHDYGITEEAMGCPILSSMETVSLGYADANSEVMIDKYAYEADAIVVVNRIKAHTEFRGPYESGLMKMIAIGLGKQMGAESCHERGFERMGHFVPLFANFMLDKVNVAFGVALIENAFDETYDVIPMTAKEIPEKEPELLLLAKKLMVKHFVEEADVLIIDRIGKNFSGDGHDPNISGKFIVNHPDLKEGIKAKRAVVLDLSDETHGNAMGLGSIDITTKRCVDKIDPEKANANAFTCTELRFAAIPPYAETDRAAICIALRTSHPKDRDHPRIVRIANTLHIEYIEISEALLPLAKNRPDVEIVGELEDFPFDAAGNLL